MCVCPQKSQCFHLFLETHKQLQVLTWQLAGTGAASFQIYSTKRSSPQISGAICLLFLLFVF